MANLLSLGNKKYTKLRCICSYARIRLTLLRPHIHYAGPPTPYSPWYRSSSTYTVQDKAAQPQQYTYSTRQKKRRRQQQQAPSTTTPACFSLCLVPAASPRDQARPVCSFFRVLPQSRRTGRSNAKSTTYIIKHCKN
jgi:hypothetical protein